MIDSPDESSREKVELQVDQGPDAYITDTTVGRSPGFCFKQRWGMAWWMVSQKSIGIWWLLSSFFKVIFFAS